MSAGFSRLVLDSWAIIALLRGEEPAATQVRTLLQEGIERSLLVAISMINLGEIFYIIGRAAGEERADDAIQTVRAMGAEIIPVDEAQVFAAARYKMQYPISYADAFAVAVASQLDAVLVTGDPELIALSEKVAIRALSRSD